MKPTKIKIADEEYWFLDEGDGSGPIAPLEHCDADGNLEEWRGLAFAHCFDGVVKRFGATIGNLADFKIKEGA